MDSTFVIFLDAFITSMRLRKLESALINMKTIILYSKEQTLFATGNQLRCLTTEKTSRTLEVLHFVVEPKRTEVHRHIAC